MVGLTAAQPGAWRADSRALLLLALPLILTNLAYVALTTIDIVVLGMLGAKELAAGGLAIALFNQLRTTGTGLVTGVSNLVAQANARGDEAQVRALLVAGLFWATVSGLVFMAVLLGLRQPLTWLGQDASVVANAMDFLLIIAPGLLPCLWFQALRHFTVGLKFPGPLLAITLVSIFLTAALNYVPGGCGGRWCGRIGAWRVISSWRTCAFRRRRSRPCGSSGCRLPGPMPARPGSSAY